MGWGDLATECAPSGMQVPGIQAMLRHMAKSTSFINFSPSRETNLYLQKSFTFFSKSGFLKSIKGNMYKTYHVIKYVEKKMTVFSTKNCVKLQLNKLGEN